MQEASLDLVAIGEFVWRVFEPEEGIYDFELFDEAIQVLGDHDIDVMLCTPTAAMPAWVQQKVPDVNVAVRLHQSRAPVAHATGWGRALSCHHRTSWRCDSARSEEILNP